MSKELEALLDLFNEANRFNNEPCKFNTLELFKRKEIIEQALQRLEQIENSNSSEALSRIEDCLYEDPYADRNDVSYENDIATLKQALINFNNITKQITDASGNSAIGLLNQIKDKLTDYNYNNILEALLKTQKLEIENDDLKKKVNEQEKVLEIIKKKKVNVYDEIMCCKNYNEYLECDNIAIYKLTEEEFNLLKRYFENELL